VPAHLLTDGTEETISGLQTKVFSGESIPSSLKKVSVTASDLSTQVPECAFIYCESITTVILREGITRFNASNAFFGYDNLTDLIVEDYDADCRVTDIGWDWEIDVSNSKTNAQYVTSRESLEVGYEYYEFFISDYIGED